MGDQQRRVNIGGEEVLIQGFSAYKALRAMQIVKHVLDAYPDLIGKQHAFIRRYEAENVIELNRAQALFRFGPERLAHLSDQDWEKAGHKLELPRSPSTQEQVAAIFPDAFEQAQKEVLELCALAVVGNRELESVELEKGEDGVDELLKERGRKLKHQAQADEALELLVVASEIAGDQIGSKVQDLGARLGNVRRLFGLEPPESSDETESKEPSSSEPSTDPPSEREDSPTKPPSSSSSDPASPGIAEPSSTEPDGSSLSSSAPA